MSSPVLLSADLFKTQGQDFQTNVPYPLYGSVKYDGIRAFTSPQGLLSRERKPIRNYYINAILRSLDYNIDGELLAVDHDGNDLSYRDTSSAVMSYDGEPRFRFRVFDYFTVHTDSYHSRYEMLKLACSTYPKHIELVEQTLIRNSDELKRFYESAIRQGKEGVMVRRLDAPYKFGRSTLNEFYLVKLKRRDHDLATIVGTKELMINENEAKLSPNGFIRRSKARDGLVPGGTLGTLIVTHPVFGEFEIGGGTYLTAIRRALLWSIRDRLPGLQVRFTHDNNKTSGYDKPRSPQLETILGDIPSP